jgi:putative sterol carrier protein
MTDVVAAVFDELAAIGHAPHLENVNATVRFDVKDGGKTQRWLVTVKKGDVQVSRRNAAADLVIRCDRSLADRLVTGKANAMSAVLRGEMTVEGSAELLMVMRRLLPRPRVARRKGVAAGYARRQR